MGMACRSCFWARNAHLLLSIASVIQFAMMTTSIQASNGAHDMVRRQNLRKGFPLIKQNNEVGDLA
jgi:hypothetical protein